ncbi:MULTISPECIES: DUF6303 family protein [Streptomyces]|uniref:DUF6303 family protein n=1 Tax=Streptomyces TaxID=1883 RepID=UPI002056669E|nr:MULTISPECIES: DUF6303 family protein [Streptomyces]UPT44005.1 DUF6303 family protein [Streptomyces sp. WAC00303]WIY78179.1 DUF6303 family protein [Streptomyces anulatus]
MPLLPEARMVLHASGTWKLYVVTGYEPRDWPVHSFDRATPVPDVPERVAALSALGYAVRGGIEWKWDATTGTRRRPFAKISVRPLTAPVAVPPVGGVA